MLGHVLAAGQAAAPSVSVVVVSPFLSDIDERLRGYGITPVIQDQPLGTGDAVARVFDRPELLPASGQMLVLYGDQPLLDGETVQRLATAAGEPGRLITLLTCVLRDSSGYGRVDRDGDRPTRIVEEKDDDSARRDGPTEIWSGMMAIDIGWARDAIRNLTPSPATGELYLTQLIGMAVDQGTTDERWPVGVVRADADVAIGVNDRIQLAEAERVYRRRLVEKLMRSGVTMTDPATVYVDADVTVGPDTEILPNTHLRAGTTIGTGCRIGPDTSITGCTIGDGVVIRNAVLDRATVHDSADVGPYSHVRAGTRIGPGAHVGSFGEFKNAALGAGAKAGHFGYLGDVTIGDGANIGAGTVVANFDGQRKHQTTIGAGAFIGSDSVLRAPVTIGDGGVVGAGSVVTRDVAPGQTVVGMPARPVLSRRAKPDNDGEPTSGTDTKG
jgi:bifunctional UDP-N-acetylglucosamine pyrophosphorylase/glucosamine-1-phosphate N-acetyltransferase